MWNMKKDEFIFPRACRLLKDIDDKGFKRLCECLHARQVHLHNKESCVLENDACDRIGIVVMGSIRLTRQRIDGGRNVLEDVGLNGVFGTTYAFRDAATMGIGASAIGETIVIIFNTEKITRPCHKVCNAHMQFVRNLLTIMSQKMFAMRQKLRILAHHTIRGRLRLFLQIQEVRAKSRVFDISYDRQALADFLYVDRSALSAELSKMQAEGILRFNKNHFEILKD